MLPHNLVFCNHPLDTSCGMKFKVIPYIVVYFITYLVAVINFWFCEV